MCCLRCCLYCLEKFLRFLNRNAYVITAIYGKSFCPAAREAFMLLLRNVVRVFVLDKTVDFCLFLGKLQRESEFNRQSLIFEFLLNFIRLFLNWSRWVCQLYPGRFYLVTSHWAML